MIQPSCLGDEFDEFVDAEGLDDLGGGDVPAVLVEQGLEAVDHAEHGWAN